MQIIQKEECFDLSDEGQQAEKLVDSLDVQMAIAKLPRGQQEILQMIIGGFTYREIENELKISPHTIRAAKKSLGAIIK